MQSGNQLVFMRDYKIATGPRTTWRPQENAEGCKERRKSSKCLRHRTLTITPLSLKRKRDFVVDGRSSTIGIDFFRMMLTLYGQ